MILKQMRELGMKQRVFGSHRTIGDNFLQLAGTAAEGFRSRLPLRSSRNRPALAGLSVSRYEARYPRET